MLQGSPLVPFFPEDGLEQSHLSLSPAVHDVLSYKPSTDTGRLTGSIGNGAFEVIIDRSSPSSSRTPGTQIATMGRPRHESHLVTPPSSSYLGPQTTESLPELQLGPPELSKQDTQYGVGHDFNQMSQGSTIYSPTSYGPTVAALCPTVTKPAARRGKPSRKTTHSQIEKRRREKINDTMQRLKDLVPACHDPDGSLRKLDVLKATADYIEELLATKHSQARGQPQPLSPNPSTGNSSTKFASPQRTMHIVDMDSEGNRPRRHVSSSISSLDALDGDEDFPSPSHPRGTDMAKDDFHAAESLIQIAESPMLRPVVERHKLSISDIMDL